MGCGSSKPEAEPHHHPASPARDREQRPMPTIGMPEEVTIHIPRNRVDNQGRPAPKTTLEINRQSLEQALAMMAQYLQRRNAQLSVIAVGGAVNVLLLRTRPSTHDVDVFGTNLDNPVRYLLDEAMHYAMNHATSPLGTDWFNTETQMWLSLLPSIESLTDEAIKQNVVVFSQPGLKILAAPWEYAFSAKLARLLTGRSQIGPYDLDGAVRYIHQVVRQNGGRPVPLATVEGWARRFHHSTSRDFLMKRVNGEYQKRHGRHSIR